MKKQLILLLTLFSLGFGFGQTTVFSESFDTSSWPSGWTHTDFTISSTSIAGGSANEARLKYDVDDPNVSHITTPSINTAGYTSLILSWKQKADYYSNGNFVIKVQTSTDNSTFSDVWSMTVTADEVATKSVTLDTGDGVGSSTLYIRWLYYSISGSAFSYWNIDDIDVSGTPANATDSDAIAPINPKPQIAATTIQSTATTNNDAVDVFRMLLQDSGSGDSLPTNVTNIRVKPHTTNTADWSDTVQGVVVYDDNNYITPSNVVITDTYIDISFNSGDLVVPDNESNNLTIGVYLNTSNIVDQSILSFMVDADAHGFTADSSGSDFATTFSGGDFNSNDFTIEVTGTELRFIQQPSTVTVFAIMSPDVTVEITDANGNREIDLATANIGLTTTGNFAGTATTTVQLDANGLATFDNLVFDQAGNNFTLTTTDPDSRGWTNATSTTFNVLNYTPCSTTNTQIIFEDFEDSTLTYTTSVIESSDNGYDYFVRYDGSNIGSAVELTNLQGNGYFGAQNTDDAPTDFTIGYLQFNNIDISNMNNFVFSVFLAEDDASDGNEDWDYDTNLHVAYRVDNGSWVNLLWVEAFNGTDSKPAIDNDFNGVGDAGDENEITDAFKLFERNFNVQGSSLDLSFKFEGFNNGTEDIAIDNIKLTGDLTNSTTWYDNAGTLEWSNGAPTTTTKAIFDADYTTTSTTNIEACACQVTGNGYVTVEAATYLDIQNEIVNEGVIIIEETGTIVQHNNDATVTGDGLYQTTVKTTSMTDARYTYFSSPTQADTMDVFSSWGATSRMFGWDGTNQVWSTVTTATTMTPGLGYIVRPTTGATFPGAFSTDFTGAFNNGVITTTLYNTNVNSDNDDDSSLVGNPYPSAINTADLLAANTYANAFYFWTHNTGIDWSSEEYAVYNNSGGTGDAPETISTGQGFFVTSTVADTFTFSNDQRVTGNNDTFLRPANKLDKVWLNVIANTNTGSQLLLGFIPNKTDGFDAQYDAKRMNSTENSISFSSNGTDANTTNLAIQARNVLSDDDTIIPLNVFVNDSNIQTATISIDHIENLTDKNIFLKDNLLNTVTDLKQGDYTFTVSQTGVINDRFEVLFSRNALAVNENSAITQLVVAQKGDYFALSTSDNHTIDNASLYNMLGQNLGFFKANSNNLQIPTTNIASGTILIIKTTLDNGSTISKKLIKL